MVIVKGKFNHLLRSFPFATRDKCGRLRHLLARLRLCSHLIEKVSREQYMVELEEELEEMIEASKRPIFNVEKRDEEADTFDPSKSEGSRRI